MLSWMAFPLLFWLALPTMDLTSISLAGIALLLNLAECRVAAYLAALAPSK